jgi:hypothetical protein
LPDHPLSRLVVINLVSSSNRLLGNSVLWSSRASFRQLLNVPLDDHGAQTVLFVRRLPVNVGTSTAIF